MLLLMRSSLLQKLGHVALARGWRARRRDLLAERGQVRERRAALSVR